MGNAEFGMRNSGWERAKNRSMKALKGRGQIAGVKSLDLERTSRSVGAVSRLRNRHRGSMGRCGEEETRGHDAGLEGRLFDWFDWFDSLRSIRAGRRALRARPGVRASRKWSS